MATGEGIMQVVLVTKRKEIRGTDQDYFADWGKASVLLIKVERSSWPYSLDPNLPRPGRQVDGGKQPPRPTRPGATGASLPPPSPHADPGSAQTGAVRLPIRGDSSSSSTLKPSREAAAAAAAALGEAGMMHHLRNLTTPRLPCIRSLTEQFQDAKWRKTEEPKLTAPAVLPLNTTQPATRVSEPSWKWILQPHQVAAADATWNRDEIFSTMPK
ncbi:uncharacterized protein LOC103681878 [Ursus maritimus]|uniref:Uncharacterized protein LOC103681878 n=1 Tax=Ursus maritimus TaxID=29073 RepID=A0A384DSE1_URSMA|nr:uncharacterized protein LOC103681878 [Ursus maritimus]